MPPLIPDPPNNTETRTNISSHESPTMWSQLQIMITDLRDQDSRTKLELETTKAKLRQQSKELQQCRDQILRTISAFQVNDQEILEELVMIRESLRNWILVLPDINGFGQSWKLAQSKMGERNLVLEVEISLWPECPLELVETDIIFFDIFYIIWKRLLMPPLAAANKDQESLLGQLLAQIRLLKPPKGECILTNRNSPTLTQAPFPDLKSIRAWRSDTYRAFTESFQYQQQLNQSCDDTVKIIGNYFNSFSFSERIEWNAILTRLFSQVVKPAAALATKLHCSPEEYSWNWGFCPNVNIQISDTDKFELIDCKTRVIASRATIRGIQDGSKLGRWVMPVFPGLCRHAETTTITIQMPTILVSFADVSLNSNLHSGVTIPNSPPARKSPKDVTIKHEDPSP